MNKLKNYTTKSIRRVIVYTMDGKFITEPTIDEDLYDGNDFFRKMTANKREKKICELMLNPHKNIVTIYGIGENYIDMELLNTDMSTEDTDKIKNVMMEVKTYLQSIGIMYIDWKLDNMGIGKDGEIKLFDFDASGLVDIETREIILKPPVYWAYTNATENGKVNINDIDDYAFDYAFEHGFFK
jgi:serine/threonine protein kinase